MMVCELMGNSIIQSFSPDIILSDIIGNMNNPVEVPISFLLNGEALSSSDYCRSLGDLLSVYGAKGLNMFTAVRTRELAMSARLEGKIPGSPHGVLAPPGKIFPEMFRLKSKTEQPVFQETREAGMLFNSAVFSVAKPQESTHAIIDCGASDTVSSPETLSCLCNHLRKVNPNSRVFIDRESGRRVKFRLANGASCDALSLVTIETPLGWLNVFALDTEVSSPTLFSIRSLKALHAAIDFETDVAALRGIDCEGTAFTIEKKLETNSRGHLLLDLGTRE
jgi:hypothetical protein